MFVLLRFITRVGRWRGEALMLFAEEKFLYRNYWSQGADNSVASKKEGIASREDKKVREREQQRRPDLD